MSKQKPWKWTRQKRRKINFRSERKTYLIITEGQSEKEYLNHFRTSTKLEIIVEKTDRTKQLSLVKKAIERRKQLVDAGTFLVGQDEVWVVFDRDKDGSNPNDEKNFNEAISMAKKEDVYVAISNDCFDLWYLLHFQEVSTTMLRQQVFDKLSEHLGRKYKSRSSKGTLVEDLYKDIKDRRGLAIKRARRMHQDCLKNKENEHQKNPLTTIYVLIEKIMGEEGFKEM